MRRQVTPEELSRLYGGIGKGIWHLQYVEDALNTLITVKHEMRVPGRVDAEAAKQALDEHRRNTLGTSVRVARDNKLISDALLAKFQDYKEERDWLVHRSQNSHGERLYTEAGRTEFFARIENFVEQSKGLQREVMAELEAYARGTG